MRIGYRFSNEGERIHVYSSSLKNTELLNFEQPWYDSNSPIKYTNSVDYPNILATNVVNPISEQPLFYVMKLPLFSYTGEKDVQNSVTLVKNGNSVPKEMYYVTHDTSNILLYTNLRNTDRPFYVVYTPYPNSTLSRTTHQLLSTEPAMILNKDYTVSYGSNYRLSSVLYVKPDYDVKGVLTNLYSADTTVPWYVFMNPITTKTFQILPTERTLTIQLPARRLEKRLYKIDANDVHQIECEGVNVSSSSRDGFAVIDSTEPILYVDVTLKTHKNIISENYLPYDFRPTMNDYYQYKLSIV